MTQNADGYYAMRVINTPFNNIKLNILRIFLLNLIFKAEFLTANIMIKVNFGYFEENLLNVFNFSYSV